MHFVGCIIFWLLRYAIKVPYLHCTGNLLMVSMTPWHVLSDGSQISYFCTNAGIQCNVHSISLALIQIFVQTEHQHKSNKYSIWRLFILIFCRFGKNILSGSPPPNPIIFMIEIVTLRGQFSDYLSRSTAILMLSIECEYYS